MAAKSGLSFNVLANCEDIKKGLEAQGYTPYNSDVAVGKAVRRYANHVKKTIIEDLKKEKLKGFRFSVTTDEWTSNSGGRFGIVNVHKTGGRYVSIGTIRIYGTFDAAAAAEKLSKRLEEFGLSLKGDIVGTTVDGASIMVSMGKKIPTLSQICHSHGAHLAVCDVVYKVRTVRKSYPCHFLAWLILSSNRILSSVEFWDRNCVNQRRAVSGCACAFYTFPAPEINTP